MSLHVGASELITLAGQFGPLGLIIGYLVWRESAERKMVREEAEKNREVTKERIAADLEMAKAFTILTVTIQGLRQ